MKFTKILSAVAVIGMLACSSAFAASTVSLKYDTDKEYKVGDDIEVELKLDANDGLVSFTGEIKTTDGLEIKEITDKKLLNGASIPTATPYTFSFNDTQATSNNTAVGTVMVITVTAKKPGTQTVTFECDSENTYDVDWEEINFGTVTCDIDVNAATPASTTSIGAATKGGNLDGQKTFYAPITIDTSKQSGARFWVSNGTKTKSWEIPSDIVGVANFYAVVKTAETGTYTYNVVSSTGTAIGTAQTVTID